MPKLKYIAILFSGILLINACDKDNDPNVVIDETPYLLEYGGLPMPDLPADNPLTVQGVELGRMLFYETMLSKDGSQACADCHQQADGFSDTNRFSIGVKGLPGGRQAMPIFNMAWHSNEFFWDGRAHLLRDQSLKPIQDPLEMNETLDNVVAKLSNTKTYRDQFMRTFGSEEITPDKMSLAMEQFMMSIVSYDSKYDRYLAGTVELTESEERGRLLFETEYNPFFPDLSGADCVHCHGGSNFENDRYMNNGLDSDATMTDMGRENVTQNPADRGKFKVPSLRNIAVTQPYMHDGRFQTLEEVIDHYNTGIQESSSVDPAILNTKATGLGLTAQDKTDLINFLKTLTDETFLNNEAYKTPF
ncbi:MAG: cytochrome-c peroxidase [Bacteroidetes bacterium]|jgi:cytochrome c peroxidase|nr:cytochrome-c peroxidase [Bacteroidota bacterium]MDF1868351.1 cytochrome c peroxidase [Saprospiraceae bacterium]